MYLDSWASEKWYDKEGSNFWVSFLSDLGFSFSHTNTNICKTHYTYLRKCLGETRCVKCNLIWSESIVTSNIFVGSMQVSHPQLAKTLIDGLHVESPLSHSWVCGACYSALKNELSLSLLLHEDVSTNDPILKCRNNYVKEMVTILSKDGILLNTNYKNMFKKDILNLGVSITVVEKYVDNFRKYVDHFLLKANYASYCKQCRLGTVYYYPSLFSSTSVPYIHDLLIKNINSLSTDKLNEWLQEQVTMFPENCSKFDYRKLIKNNKFDD